MLRRTGINLTLLLCSTLLTTISSNCFSQTATSKLSSVDCTDIPTNGSNAETIAANLDCYNQKLDTLSDALAALISERQQLNHVVGAQNKHRTGNDELPPNNDKEAIQKLQLERAELRAQLHQLNSKRQPELLGVEADERLFRNYSEAYASLMIENDELRKLLAERQQSISEQQKKTKVLLASKNQYAAQIEKLDSEIAQLKIQNKQAQAKSTAFINERDRTLSSLNDKLSSLNNSYNTTTEILTSTERNLHDANQQVKNLESALETAQSTSASLRESRDKALTDLAALTRQNKAQLNDMNALQIGRDQLATELDSARPEIMSLKNNIQLLETENSNLTQTINDLQQKIEQADASTSELQVRLTQSEKYRISSQEKVAILTTSVSTLENILDESLASNKLIESSLLNIKTDLTASQQRLDTKQAQLQKLIAEKEALIEAQNRLKNDSRQLASQIEKNLTGSGVKSVTVTQLANNNLKLRVDSSLLFRTGSSKLSTEGQKLLADIGRAIEPVQNRRIMIEGHSDNVPLGAKLSAIFKDNRGLSLARALSTAGFFTDKADIPSNRLSISGAGATKPLATNDTPEGRQRNRRVEILLLAADDDQPASTK